MSRKAGDGMRETGIIMIVMITALSKLSRVGLHSGKTEGRAENGWLSVSVWPLLPRGLEWQSSAAVPDEPSNDGKWIPAKGAWKADRNGRGNLSKTERKMCVVVGAGETAAAGTALRCGNRISNVEVSFGCGESSASKRAHVSKAESSRRWHAATETARQSQKAV